jgi:hypothetical protein
VYVRQIAFGREPIESIDSARPVFKFRISSSGPEKYRVAERGVFFFCLFVIRCAGPGVGYGTRGSANLDVLSTGESEKL